MSENLVENVTHSETRIVVLHLRRTMETVKHEWVNENEIPSTYQ